MRGASLMLVAGGLVLVGTAIALSRRKKVVDQSDGDVENDPEEPRDVNKPSKVLPPIVVGEATDPSVAPYLAQLDARLATAGVNLKRINAFMLTVMTKAPLTDGPDHDDDKTRPVAIPPLEYWDGLVETAAFVNDVEEREGLDDLHLRHTGYRPADYNAAVGGAAHSAHVFPGDAIDVWLGNDIIAHSSHAELEAKRERLKMAFARAIVHSSKKNRFGFGVYTNDIHVDLSRSHLTDWEHGGEYLAKAKNEKVA